MLHILDFECRGIVLYVLRNKNDADQLRTYYVADLCLCFFLLFFSYVQCRISRDVAHISFFLFAQSDQSLLPLQNYKIPKEVYCLFF